MAFSPSAGMDYLPPRMSSLMRYAIVGFAAAVNSIRGAILGQTVPGWSSLMAAIGILTGVQFLMLGIIGAYLGRLYDQSKGRPLFLIRDIVGGEGSTTTTGSAGQRATPAAPVST